jgi:hypothetical protein
VSLRNAAVGVGASCRSSKVSSMVLPVPLTDICLLRSVRSGNDGRPRVVPWGASMSLHLVSRVPIVYLCLRLRASESGTYAFPHTQKVSRFPLPPTAR